MRCLPQEEKERNRRTVCIRSELSAAGSCLDIRQRAGYVLDVGPGACEAARLGRERECCAVAEWHACHQRPRGQGGPTQGLSRSSRFCSPNRQPLGIGNVRGSSEEARPVCDQQGRHEDWVPVRRHPCHDLTPYLTINPLSDDNHRFLLPRRFLLPSLLRHLHQHFVIKFVTPSSRFPQTESSNKRGFHLL